jgi:hypothetical protein
MARTSFVDFRHVAQLGSHSTEADAIAAVREDLSSLAPQAIALSGYEVVKRDGRGRAKQSWASRELAARVLGQPLESLGPWIPLPSEEFEAAVASGRDFSFGITPDGGGWVLRVHFERFDDRGNALGRDKLFLAWDESRTALEARSRAFKLLADNVADRSHDIARR